MAVTFSAASMFLLLPLFGGALLLGGVGVGLSAGAFLLPGLVFSFFNLVGFWLPRMSAMVRAACSSLCPSRRQDEEVARSRHYPEPGGDPYLREMAVKMLAPMACLVSD